MKKFEGIYRENIEDFIHKYLTNRPHPLFEEVENFAIKERVPIISPATGEAIRYIVQKEAPRRILELGTGLGYSILWMLSTNLELEIDTIERNKKCITDAKIFIDRYKKENQIINYLNLHILETIEKENNLYKYDLIFIDCDKICYPQLILLLIQKIRKNSLLLFDNVLWHGRLESKFKRPSDLAMQEFWKLVKNAEIKRTLFPLGDGLLILHF